MAAGSANVVAAGSATVAAAGGANLLFVGGLLPRRAPVAPRDDRMR